MSDKEYAQRSNCPTMCPCLCHDGFGGAHHGQRCAEPQIEWHFAYLGMEYRHPGRKEDCEACANWQLRCHPLHRTGDNQVRNPIALWRARRDVVMSAKLVESGYEPDLNHEFDPDDLADLVRTVRRLRNLEDPRE